MRVPQEWYQLEAQLAAHLPELRPAQQRGLAWWVYGTVLAGSACQHAVLAVLLELGPWHAWRQYLREWLYDGADRAAPTQPRTQLDVTTCFAPLLRWLLGWWQGDQLALAIDATAHGATVEALVVSVLYRSCAIPVAWAILPANEPGAWMPRILTLLRQLQPAVPRRLPVLVLADRGLWSPALWTRIRRLGWHPLLRVRGDSRFRPAGYRRHQAARSLVAGPGHAWVGTGVAFKHRPVCRAATLLVVWDADQAEPWVLLTDLAPDAVGVCWYGLRVWIELGFRALKGLGWQWEHTRRTDPARVARHWLVLAVATLDTLAYGTRAEDAAWLGVPPANLRVAPALPAPPAPRTLSVFRRGLACFQRHLLRGHLWGRLWLTAAPWPSAPPSLVIHYHVPT
jgi:hypothetical protein